MKKTLITVLILCAFSTVKAQYLTRYNYAQKDSIRTQTRMALVEASVERYDTATGNRHRLAAEMLAIPTSSRIVDMFVYPIVVLLQTATPTDAQIKALVVTLWNRVAEINTQPLNRN